MIRNIYLLAVLCLILSNIAYTQAPRCRSLDTSSGVLGAAEDLPTNTIADDFGPRNFGSTKWHGGIDFNAAGTSGDEDMWYPMISPQAGTFADFDHLTNGQDRYKYALVNVTDDEGNGSHTLLFGHVFDWMHQFYNEFNGRIVLKRCEAPNINKWGLHLSFTDAQGHAVQHTYGQIAGATLDINGVDEGGTFVTTNSVNTTDIFMPMGRSGGTPTNRFKAHLHLNTIPYNTEITGYDELAVNGDPCQFLNIDRPQYDILAWSKGNPATQGIKFNYPGTESTKFKVRVQMKDEALDMNRYNHLMDMDKVEVQIKESNSSTFELIRGDKIEAIISEGSKLGEESINLNKLPIDKFNWNSTGVHTNAYNSQSAGNNARNPWDDYFFVDFPTRIHKMDELGNTNPTLFSDTPINSRYKDEWYDIRVKATTSNNASLYKEVPYSPTLDNFQPFITKAAFRYNNSLAYNIKREQNEGVTNTQNDGYVTNVPYNPPVLSYGLPSQMDVEITTSEPMKNVKINHYPPVPQAPELNLDMVKDMNDPLVWRYTKIGFGVRSEECHGFTISGTDLSDNPIMNIGARTNGNDMTTHVILPTRKATSGSNATQWTSPDSIHIGRDTFKVCFEGCTFLTGNESIGNRSTTDCENLAGVTSQVQYLNCETPKIFIQNIDYPHYHISWHDANGPLQQYDNQYTLEVGAGIYCYRIQTNNDCCDIEGCVTVENDNITQLQNVGISMDECTGGDIDLGLDPTRYQIIWTDESGTQMSELEGSAHITNLNTGTYCYSVRQYGSNCTFEACIPINIDHKLLRIKSGPVITQPSDCNESNGNITFYGGTLDATLPCHYEWSNGKTELSNFDLQSGVYTLTITDALGCTLEKSYTLGLIGENYFHLVGINNACQGENNGDIFISVLGGINCVWNDDNHTEGPVLIGVPSGTYCVDFYGQNGNICNNQACFEIPSIPSDGTFEIVDEVVTNTCEGSSNGAINFHVIGGNSPYKYQWSDLSSNISNRENLKVGEYYLTISDNCHRTLIKTFLIKNSTIDVDTIYGVSCTETAIGSITLNPYGENGPFDISWSTGQIGTNTIEAKFGKTYSATITNSLGCQKIVSNLIKKHNDLFIVKNEGGCVGFDDGRVKVKILNPNQGNFLLTLDSVVIFTTTEKEDTFWIENLPNTPPNQNTIKYPFTIGFAVDDCVDLMKFKDVVLLAKNPALVFDHFDSSDTLCVYNEICHGEIVGDNSVKLSPKIDWQNQSLIDCDVPKVCPNTNIEVGQLNGFFVFPSAGEIRFLHSALQNVYPWYYFDFAANESMSAFSNAHDCDVFKMCANTLIITGAWLDLYIFGGDGLTPLDNEGNCFKVECDFLQDPNFCVDDVIEFLNFTTGGNISPQVITDCNPRGYQSIQQLIQNWNYLMNQAGFEYSDLYYYLQNIIDDPILLEKAACANISFCRKNWDNVKSNINEIDCSQIVEYELTVPCDVPGVSYCIVKVIDYACSPLYNNKGYICQNGFRKINNISLFTSSRDSTIQQIIGINDTINFEKFGYKMYNGISNIIPIYSAYGRQYYTKYNPRKFITNFEYLDSLFNIGYDYGNQIEYYLYKKSQNKSNYSVETSIGSKGNSIFNFNGDKIDIKYFLADSGNLNISGTFEGYFSVNNIQMSTENGIPGSFEFVIDHTGQILKQIINNDSTKSYYSSKYKKILSYNMIQDYKINLSIKDFGNITWTPIHDIKLVDDFDIVESMEIDSNLIVVVKGQGNIYLDNQVIYTSNNECYVTLLFDKNGHFVKILNNIKGSICSSFTYDEGSNLIFSVSFSQNCEVNGVSLLTNKSQDALIFNQNIYTGQLAKTTPSPQVSIYLKEIIFSQGKIMLGGDVSPTYAPDFQIGETTFISNGIAYPTGFVSFIESSNFIPFNSDYNLMRLKDQFNVSSMVSQDVLIYPNPFTNSLTLDMNSKSEIDSKITVFDQYGKLIFEDMIQLGKGDNRYIFADSYNWIPGVYIFKISSNEGESSHKVIKLN